MTAQAASVAVGLLGDVMLGRGVGDALATQHPEALWAPELREEAASLDLVVCNLECCLSDRGRPTSVIAGKPFFFRGPPAAVQALGAMNVRIAGVANNHALDFGEVALQDTLRLLREAGVATAGAGHGIATARQAAIVTAGDLRVGVIAASDHPPEYAAAPGHWGIALAALHTGLPGWLRAQIAELRAQCDLVIAFPHWGPNMTDHPAGWQQSAAEELHAAGADLVAGHSAHVFHGVGWRGGPTLFDLGDALDDYRIDPQLRNDLGVLAIWRPRAEPPLELVGLRLGYCTTGLARGADAEWIATRLQRACAALGTGVTRQGEQRFVVGPA